ncbi:MAG TPA: Tim44-like domain-containing protein [Paucimonas sp.]|nr:Tim44-like domain-containing protein [Paucimonas sp.]
MKRTLVAMMMAFAALAVTVPDADAKRLGGGGAIGKQSQNVSRQTPTNTPNQAGNTAQQAQPAPGAAPQAAPAKPASSWKGILGGALAGLGLGMLFSHLGLGGAIGNILGTLLMVALLAVAVMFLMRLFRRNNGNQPAYAGAGAAGRAHTPEIGSRVEPRNEPAPQSAAQPIGLQSSGPAGGNTAPWGVPADFDVAGFLRHAKTHFIRLQAAWDKADVNDIREFTTPEMFAELKMQLQERGASPNHTDVVSLDAELLGIDTVGADYLASVKFSGMIKEAENAPAAPFAEVWNLAKPRAGQGGWLLAGIQQLS